MPPVCGATACCSPLPLTWSIVSAPPNPVNAVMTATYWEIGRRIVEVEQRGKKRAEYGEALLKKLASDLTARFGKGFGLANLKSIRKFFLTWPEKQIGQTVSGQSASELTPLSPKKGQTLSDLSSGGQGIARLRQLAVCFPLPWSHYVRLMALSSEEARHFYETEALRCGWSVRQLDRQISSQFYERTALSRNKTAMLKKSSKADLFTPEEEINDPFVLEFLGLKDEYSESDLEEALILHLEAFVLELVETSPSLPANAGSGSATSGIVSTYSFFTASCVAWSLLISNCAASLTPTWGKCTSIST